MIPRVVSEHRRYFTVRRFPDGVKASDAAFTASDPDGYVLGLLSSSMFMAWMKAVGGRLKSDLRFSKTFTYNTFPMPATTDRQVAAIVAAASEVEAARERHAPESLAELYAPVCLYPNLANAHRVLDDAVDAVFGRVDLSSIGARQKALFRQYANLTNGRVENYRGADR
jgi:hypothetical protein